MPKLVYVVACVVVPIGWGAAVAALSGALRRGRGDGADEHRRPFPPIDYYI